MDAACLDGPSLFDNRFGPPSGMTPVLTGGWRMRHVGLTLTNNCHVS